MFYIPTVTIASIPANDPNAEITRHYVDDPLKRSTKLKGLEPDREYILYIWARTNAGVGDQDWLEDKTIVAGRKYIALVLVGNILPVCVSFNRP